MLREEKATRSKFRPSPGKLPAKKRQLNESPSFDREDLPAIVPTGRSETADFFSKYLKTRGKNKAEDHFPYLVFVNPDMGGYLREWVKVEIHIARTIADVLKYQSKAIVMKQWPGKTRSDWFWFTVEELKKEMKSW